MTRVPVDAAQVIKDWLALKAQAAHPDLRVTLEVPADWSLGSGPVLLVADDGDPASMWPVATSPTIRVTSWTSGRDRTFVHWAAGLLLGARIPGVAAVLPGTGIIEARDSRTRGDLAGFTVRARLRTTVS